ncbi:hypothetical protein ACFOY8_13615 [Thalassospira xianhensis]|uniref:Uncharacterized protein n=2 Tax=Thalassospira TaxID=168934 RepID=A0A285TSU9_9PROT|nr:MULTISPECIES: hypothetical protein [Thalassospira]SOC26887.1 hypothetical protein SAMN05428964_105226 [Thalassospira xiamenensis]
MRHDFDSTELLLRQLPQSARNEHLIWMFDTVTRSYEDFPVDKAARWIGFIHGSLREPVLPEVWSSPSKTRSRCSPVSTATGHLVARYREMVAGYQGDARPLVTAISTMERAIDYASDGEIGFWTGYLQALLVDEGLTTVAAEREYTRPVFHQAYHFQGISIPLSFSPHKL